MTQLLLAPVRRVQAAVTVVMARCTGSGCSCHCYYRDGREQRQGCPSNHCYACANGCHAGH